MKGSGLYYFTGSRADPNIKKDRFRDFDIIYIVRETDTFLNDHSYRYFWRKANFTNAGPNGFGRK